MKKGKINILKIAGSMGVILTVCFVTVLLFSITEARFKIENENIVAVEYDIANIINNENEEKARETVFNEFLNAGVNTLILDITNLVSENKLSQENINILNDFSNSAKDFDTQVSVSLDNAVLNTQNINDVAQILYDELKISILNIENSGLNSQEITTLQKIINNDSERGMYLSIQSSDSDYLLSLTNLDINYYVYEAVSSNSFNDLQNAISDNAMAILHYSAKDYEKIQLFSKINNTLNGVVYTKVSDDLSVLNSPLNKLVTEIQYPTFDFSVSNEFRVTNFFTTFDIYSNGVFLVGVGEENGIVTVNDVEYKSQPNGTFGIYHPLSIGKNEVVVSQNGVSETFEFNRIVSSGYFEEATFDNTKKADEGDVVITFNPLTSIISDVDDDSSIIAGLSEGTQLIVKDSVVTNRSGYKTYAYELSGGGYVLAKNVEFIDEYTQSVIKQGEVSVMENGDVVITYESFGKPGVISIFEENSLSFAFLDTNFEQETQLESDMFSAVSYIVSEETNAVITFNDTKDKIWGYDILQTENSTIIYLKAVPQQVSGDKPLTGVSIFLDAGHGGTDTGTQGVVGEFGPVEKDLNLAIALTTKAMLEEYGATVILSRSDDTFLELWERRDLTRDARPDLFISLHHNSMSYSTDSSNTQGVEVYYFTKQSESFASVLSESIAYETNRVNRGAKNGYYYVARVDIAPSVLCEYSFLINPEEYSQSYTQESIYNASFATLQAVLKIISK